MFPDGHLGIMGNFGTRQMTDDRKASAPKRQPAKQAPAPPQAAVLKDLGGSCSDNWNNVITNQALASLWLNNSDDRTRDQQINAVVAGLMGIGPKDELEGMIAGQLIAAHNAAMECYRRAMIGEQTFEGRRENLSQANKLSRSFATLLEALNRHRGKGQQKVTVEHVHVHEGGQAIVGHVEHKGGGFTPKPGDQPHAKQIAHAPQPEMPGPHPPQDPVPIPSHAERPLPDARRKVSGGSEG